MNKFNKKRSEIYVEVTISETLSEISSTIADKIVKRQAADAARACRRRNGS